MTVLTQKQRIQPVKLSKQRQMLVKAFAILLSLMDKGKIEAALQMLKKMDGEA